MECGFNNIFIPPNKQVFQCGLSKVLIALQYYFDIGCGFNIFKPYNDISIQILRLQAIPAAPKYFKVQ